MKVGDTNSNKASIVCNEYALRKAVVLFSFEMKKLTFFPLAGPVLAVI